MAFWYLNNGAKVALVGRDIKELSYIASLYPSTSIACQCDLNMDKNILDLKNAVLEKFGRLDVLINCAGVLFNGDVVTTHPEDYDYSLDVNMRAPFILAKCFHDQLKISQGSIINVSADKATRPEAGVIAYSMVKAGLEMMTKMATG